MARYLGPKAKLSRREGTDLFLKSARRAIGDKANSIPSQVNMAALLVPVRLITVCNCAKNKKSNACMAF